MNKIKKILIFIPMLIISFSSSSNEVNSKERNYSKEEIESIINQSIRLLNYETREKELILEPLKMKRDEVLKFLPPLNESPIIYDMYIEAGFNIVDAIRYTHLDILELYKDYK